MPSDTPPDPFGDLLTNLNSKIKADTSTYGITAEELITLDNLSTEYAAKRQAKRDKAREADAAAAALVTVTKANLNRVAPQNDSHNG